MPILRTPTREAGALIFFFCQVKSTNKKAEEDLLREGMRIWHPLKTHDSWLKTTEPSYHRSRFTLLISSERLFLKIAIMMANPTTASAAATASEKNTRTCPSMLP